MRYILYKITNLVNGKTYIGKHQCKRLDDRYFGSGTVLKRAIEKYGIENFVFEVLFELHNPDELALLEKCVVTEEFCRREDTYNAKPGGIGGFVTDATWWTNGTENLRVTECPGEGWVLGRTLSPDTLEKMKSHRGENHWNFGGHISEETKRKISDGHKGKHLPPEQIEKMKASMEGFIWWTNGTEDTRARECPGPGWRRGCSKREGLRHWTNGTENVLSRECPGEGWHIGLTIEFTEERLQKMREASLGKHLSPEAKEKCRLASLRRGKNTPEQNEKIAKSKLGRHWWHKDGVKRFSKECPGEGWEPGMGDSERSRKIGEAHRGRKHCEEWRRKVMLAQGEPVEQLDMEGNVVAEFPSGGEATRVTGIANISRAISTNTKAGGYRWRKKAA